jgi:hypothetical protein
LMVGSIFAIDLGMNGFALGLSKCLMVFIVIIYILC